MIETIVLIAICAAVVIWKKRPVEGIHTISTDELQTMLRDDDKIFIDVRSARDFNKMHVAPFINDPKGLGMEALPRDKEIVVMCRSGMRSLETCKKLKKLGVKKVTNVRGGMSAYVERGLHEK